MATFSLTGVMFGDQGIAHIPDISLSDRAAILAKVVRKLFEQGHDFGAGDDTLPPEQMQKLIDEAKGEVCGVFGARKLDHGVLH